MFKSKVVCSRTLGKNKVQIIDLLLFSDLTISRKEGVYDNRIDTCFWGDYNIICIVLLVPALVRPEKRRSHFRCT